MFQNVRPALVSFVWVALAYGLYLVCVVPFVERTFSPATQRPLATVDSSGPKSIDRFVREIEPLFREDAWELKQPKVLRSQQAMLLLQDFKQLEDGSLHIQPCTLVLFGEQQADGKAGRGPTILQAPKGAILVFDKPMDLSKGKLGNPIGGTLVGSIRIFSKGGPDSDDLEMVTSNVQISERRVWTKEQVTFRLGNNYGAGRYLVISRTPRNQPGRPKRDTWLTDLGTIELEQLERLSLKMAEGDMFSAFGSSSPNNLSGQNATPSTRVEVSCRGPLRFDFRRMIATVEKQVTISRQSPGQPVDTLHADQLSMHFTRAAKSRRIDGQPGKTPQKLALTRVIAMGDPVVINAPSQSAHVEAKRLEYDFTSKRIKLRGFVLAPGQSRSEAPGQVRLSNLQHELTAPAIDLLTNQDRRKWEFIAEGPGEYVGTTNIDGNSKRQPQRPPRQLAASWTKRLSLQPFQDQQVLRVEGHASLRSPGVGAIRADELELWMKQEQVVVSTRIDTGQAETTTKITPVKLLTRSKAGQRTTISSPQLNGTLAKITMHFQQTAKVTAGPLTMQSGNAQAAANVADPAEPKPRYRVNGGELMAWVDAENRQLHRIRLQGDSRIYEESAAKDPPFEVAGSLIDLQTDSQGRPLARLLGTPATLTTPKLSISGNDIQLIGDRNRVVIPGPGTISLPISKNLLARDQPLATPETAQPDEAQRIDVRWQDSLQFDGRVANLLGQVEASGTDLVVRTEELSVTLDRMIDFAKLDQLDVQPAVAFVEAKGGVFGASRRRDDQGKPASYQQIVTVDLQADLKTGETVASGPGWLAATSRGMNLPALTGTATSPPDPDRLTQLSVAFAHQLTGNLIRREAHLEDDIRGWFGPVQSWEDRVDPLQITQLGEDEFRLSCHEVFLLESPAARPTDSRQPIEFLAQGQTYIEGQLYAGKGHQIKYAEDKGMLTFEGDAQRPAQLWQRSTIGGPVSASSQVRRISFWPKSGEMIVSGLLGVDLSALPRARK